MPKKDHPDALAALMRLVGFITTLQCLLVQEGGHQAPDDALEAALPEVVPFDPAYDDLRQAIAHHLPAPLEGNEAFAELIRATYFHTYDTPHLTDSPPPPEA